MVRASRPYKSIRHVSVLRSATKTLEFVLLVVLFPATLYAHEIKIGDLVIVHPMVDEAALGDASAKGSLKIRNQGKTPDQLLSINASFADRAKTDPTVPVSIPADSRSVSVLISFENIKTGLSEDEVYSGEMVFEKAGRVPIDFIVHKHAH
jgi:copper(I)-binding protein